MLRNLRIMGLLFVVALALSCGTKKKLQAAVAESDSLRTKNAELTNTINGLQKQVSDLSTTNKAITDQYAQYKKGCEATEAKLQAVQTNLDEQRRILQNVQDKLDQALVNFKDKGVSVYYKDGMVHVEMQDALLYKSGSAVLNQNGADALSSVCSVLADYPNLKVIVVGNTDSVMFKKGATDNWTLSTERANGVVRIMRDKYAVDPVRLTSAGRGKYNPVADNGTPEGRSKNRRTDIVLNPDLEKIWEAAKEAK